jgi:ankyrin repeat protein
MKPRIYFIFLFISIFSCDKNSSEIKDQLKEAIETSDLEKIESIIKSNPNQLNTKIFKLNPLEYSIVNDHFASFNKLIQLGADVNYVGNEKQSILLTSLRYYPDSSGLKIKPKYIKKLLKSGANPNYLIQNGFTNKNGGYVIPISPICKASTMSLKIVKMLIHYGADYLEPAGGDTPLGFAVKARNFDIVYYYIETLKVDLNKPVAIINMKYQDEIKTYYIKDYIKKYMKFTNGSSSYIKTDNLINKINSLKKAEFHP